MENGYDYPDYSELTCEYLQAQQDAWRALWSIATFDSGTIQSSSVYQGDFTYAYSSGSPSDSGGQGDGATDYMVPSGSMTVTFVGDVDGTAYDESFVISFSDDAAGD